MESPMSDSFVAVIAEQQAFPGSPKLVKTKPSQFAPLSTAETSIVHSKSPTPVLAVPPAVAEPLTPGQGGTPATVPSGPSVGKWGWDLSAE